MTSPEEPRAGAERPGIRAGTWILLLLVLLALLVVGWVWTLTPALYKAQAAVFVESPFPKRPMELDGPLIPIELTNRFVADQAVLLKDEIVLREVLQDAAVRATDWFQSQPDAYEALEELKDDLSAKPVPETSYLMVSFATRVPKDAATIVNTVIDKYLAKVENLSRTRYGTELENYEKTQNQLAERLQRIRREKEDFIASELGVPGITEGPNVVGDTWRALAAAVTRLEAEKLQYKAAYENLLGKDESSTAISPDVQVHIEQDPRIARLRDSKLSLELELEVALPETPDNRETLEAIRKELKVVDRKLDELLAQREKDVRAHRLQSAQMLYLNAVQAELAVRERMLETEAKQRDLDRALAQYRSLEDDQILLEDQLARIRDFVSELRMVIRSREMLPVRRVGQAFEPEKPDTSLRILVTAIAPAAPIAFGILLLLVRAVRGRRIV